MNRFTCVLGFLFLLGCARQGGSPITAKAPRLAAPSPSVCVATTSPLEMSLCRTFHVQGCNIVISSESGSSRNSSGAFAFLQEGAAQPAESEMKEQGRASLRYFEKTYLAPLRNNLGPSLETKIKSQLPGCRSIHFEWSSGFAIKLATREKTNSYLSHPVFGEIPQTTLHKYKYAQNQNWQYVDDHATWAFRTVQKRTYVDWIDQNGESKSYTDALSRNDTGVFRAEGKEYAHTVPDGTSTRAVVENEGFGSGEKRYTYGGEQTRNAKVNRSYLWNRYTINGTLTDGAIILESSGSYNSQYYARRPNGAEETGTLGSFTEETIRLVEEELKIGNNFKAAVVQELADINPPALSSADVGPMILQFTAESPEVLALDGESLAELQAAYPMHFAFSALMIHPPSLGQPFVINDFLTELHLEYTEGDPGRFDLNDDDRIDAADAGVLFANWGQVVAGRPGDFNLDGVVDAADAGLLFQYWGDSP